MPPPEPPSPAESALNTLVSGVYDDIAAPAAKRVGQAIETVFKVGLSPVAMLDWGFEKCKARLTETLEQRLAKTPHEYRTVPHLATATSAIAGYASTVDQPPLQNLYAELLLKSLDRRTKDLVHPSFIAVVSQLTPLEALILVALAQRNEDALFHETWTRWHASSTKSIEWQFAEFCQSVAGENTASPEIALTNMLRLGLLKIEEHSESELSGSHEKYREPSINQTNHRTLMFTEFGLAFYRACEPSAA
jgi:hypothetical protein